MGREGGWGWELSADLEDSVHVGLGEQESGRKGNLFN